MIKKKVRQKGIVPPNITSLIKPTENFILEIYKLSLNDDI